MDLGKPEKRIKISRTVPQLPDEPATQPAPAETGEQAATSDSAGT
jgi:hypothetical protein